MTQTIKERLNALPNPSRRKLTLFACSCVREIWHLLEYESKNAIIAAEKYVDGLISKDGMKKAAAAYDAVNVSAYDAAYDAAYAAFAASRVTNTTHTVAWAADAVAYVLCNKQQALAKQHQLFDDIFGS